MDEVKLEAIVQNFISIIPLFKKKLWHDNCKCDNGNTCSILWKYYWFRLEEKDNDYA